MTTLCQQALEASKKFLNQMTGVCPFLRNVG
jgi:hypothetical protein